MRLKIPMRVSLESHEIVAQTRASRQIGAVKKWASTKELGN
jgi:hypothetical protein